MTLILKKINLRTLRIIIGQSIFDTQCPLVRKKIMLRIILESLDLGGRGKKKEEKKNS